MSQKTEWVMKACLSRCSEQERTALERFLPPSEQKHLHDLPHFEAEMDNWGHGSRIHWSWFLSALKTYPSRDQKLFVSALDPHAAEQLKTSLNIKTAAEPLTEIGKAYLQEQLFRSLSEEQILPAEFLPPSPLNVLTTLGKKELIRLINFLSLYDLSAELRQIVETKILKKIYSYLSKEQQTALKTISSQSHLLLEKGLDKWDGTKESLELLLHRRGLVRLAVALSGQHPDLIWTICHHLDIGRGGTLAKLCGKEPVAEMSEVAIEQVLESLKL